MTEDIRSEDMQDDDPDEDDIEELPEEGTRASMDCCTERFYSKEFHQ
jgi:hypothetical protein